jgi:putative endonuclease
VIYRIADALRHWARRRRWPADHAEGRRGEDLAHRYLRSHGYTVVARNYRLPSGGELDVVAWDGDVLAIVEVKTRSSADFGVPEEAIGPEKRRALLRAGAAYARRASVAWERVRFDAVSVVMTRPPAITLRKDILAKGRPEP